MSERAITILILTAFFLLTGCESWNAYFETRRPVSNRDPMLVYCKAVGLIRWEDGTPAETLRAIKIHNGARRLSCPADKYPLWYYNDVGAEPPTPEKITVTP